MEVWAFDDSLPKETSKTIVSYLQKQTHDKDLATNTGKLWSLYKYLTSRKFSSPDEIRESVFLDSKHTEHAFTPSQAKQVYDLLYSKKGGASSEDVEVLDNVILRWIYFIREWTPAFVTDITDELTPYIFILKGMEENEEFGVLLGVALDATEAGLKTTAGAIQSMAPIIVGLLPLPEAGPIGAILGWMVSSVFIVLLVAIHISREHFGQAFISSFGLIPIVGQSLYNAAMSGERFLTKTSAKRERLIESTRKVLGDGVADTLESTIPDPLAPPPEMKKEEGTEAKGAEAKGAEGTEAGEAELAKALADYKPIAGKRFSKKHVKKSKWRTQRNKLKKRSVNGSH